MTAVTAGSNWLQLGSASLGTPNMVYMLTLTEDAAIEGPKMGIAHIFSAEIHILAVMTSHMDTLKLTTTGGQSNK